MATITKRKGRKGTSYLVRVRRLGRAPLTQTFTTMTEARAWGEQTETDLRRGKELLPRQLQRRTLSELIKKYREDALPASCTGAYGPHLDWWEARLGSWRLADIGPAEIAKCREELGREPGNTGKQRGPATINRYLNTLSAVFAFGESEDIGWVQHNPVRKVRRKVEPQGRVRFLSRPEDEPDSEVERLLAACRKSKNRDLYDIAQLALLTGMREGEILALRRRYVRLQEGGIVLPAEVTKTREGRFVPLVGPALAIVAERSQRKRDFLFGETGRANASQQPAFPQRAWLAALHAAGIADFRFHDLRHTHGSYLAMAGATLRELMDALGHRTPEMAARYSHLAGSHKRKVAERLLEVIPLEVVPVE
jgi:integrase